MKKYIVIMLYAFLAPTVSQANIIDSVVGVGLANLPNSVLRAGLEEVAPVEAKLLVTKLNGLYKQCKTLAHRKNVKTRSNRRKLYRLARRGRRRGALKPNTMVALVKNSDLAKMKNDHSNAVRRASEMEDYLVSVREEIALYLRYPEYPGYPFVQSVLNSVGERPFIIRGLQQLIDSRLLPDIRSIKESIQKAEYRDCKKNIKGYNNA